MTDRFKWCICCFLILIMQSVAPPVATNATAATRAGDPIPASIPAQESSVQNTRSQAQSESGTTLLWVDISSGRPMVSSGEFVNYELTVTNTSKHLSAHGIRLMDVLPAGFRFKSGSVRFNGISASDPVVSADGRGLTFTIGDLAPAASSAIRFDVEISSVNTLGKAVNVASAFSGDGGMSNIAKTTVTFKDELPRTETASDIPSAPRPEKIHSSSEPDRGMTVQAFDTNPVSAKVAETDAPPAASPPVVPSPSAASPPVVPSPTEPLKTLTEKSQPVENNSTGNPVVKDNQSLSELVGMSEISVSADSDGQFVKNMSENQIIENETASLVNDADLRKSIRAGRSFNRESLAALARTEQAKAQTGQAFALLLPSVSLRANTGSETSQPSVKLDEITRQPLSSDTHVRTDAVLTVRQPLFDLPSFRDWRRRKVLEQARGENYRVSDGDAYISAVNAYLSLVSSRLQMDMTRNFEAQLAELLSYIEKRTNAGAASISDMARVRARSQATQSSRLEQESAHSAAGIEFVRLTNLVPRKIRLPLLEDVGASMLPKSFDLAVVTAMKYNPEITELAAELQAADIDATAVKSRYLPRVDAEYTESYSLHAGGDTSSSGQRDRRIMAVLNWSLFSGGGDYKNHVERTARHKELQYRLDDQRRRVVQVLSANYATLATTRERISSGYQELKSISTAAEAMSKRMLSGNQSLLDLLDVYDRFYQVRSRLVTLHVLEMSTVAQLVRLTIGTPGTPSGETAKSFASGMPGSTNAPVPASGVMIIQGDGDSEILAKLKAGAIGAFGTRNGSVPLATP